MPLPAFQGHCVWYTRAMNDLIHENILRLCVPIPFPLRDVNMYALPGREGWALIDTGIGTPDTRAAFAAALARTGLQIQNLRTIVLTHNHPDHIGLSGELQEQSGARVSMHALDEAPMQEIWTQNPAAYFNQNAAFLQRHGLPATEHWLGQIPLEVVRTIIRIPPHTACSYIEDGQYIDLAGEDYRVIWTPGHSDGQICLFRERDGTLFSADHVLPRVTPNIGLYSAQARINPLHDYLEALEKIARLPIKIVLPGHGEPITDAKGRIAEIVAHHEQRLADIEMLLARQPQHAYALTQRLFGARLKNDEAWRMAVAEVLAHLEYLRFQGRVRQHENDEGLIEYTTRK